MFNVYLICANAFNWIVYLSYFVTILFIYFVCVVVVVVSWIFAACFFDIPLCYCLWLQVFTVAHVWTDECKNWWNMKKTRVSSVLPTAYRSFSLSHELSHSIGIALIPSKLNFLNNFFDYRSLLVLRCYVRFLLFDFLAKLWLLKNVKYTIVSSPQKNSVHVRIGIRLTVWDLVSLNQFYWKWVPSR